MNPVVVAIDGVSGAGKSTLARALAERLGFSYLDTGAMYRALTHKALRLGVSFADSRGLYRAVRDSRLRLSKSGKRVWLDGKEVTRAIRNISVSQHVSQLAKVSAIRHWMVRMQRKMAQSRSVVMEGRDIGTVVFPKAKFKFFITASLKERARRRHAQMRAAGTRVAFRTVLRNLADRDHKDSSRKVSPLRRASDAMVVDSTRMSAGQKTEHVLACIRSRQTKK